MCADRPENREPNAVTSPEVAEKLKIQKELGEAMQEAQTLHLESGTEVRIGATVSQISTPIDVLIDPETSFFNRGEIYYVRVFEHNTDGSRGELLGIVRLEDIKYLDSQAHAQSLEGKMLEIVGEGVEAQKGAEKISLDAFAGKNLKAEYFREVRGRHYVSLYVQESATSPWQLVGYVPAENLRERTTPVSAPESSVVVVPEPPSQEPSTLERANNREYGESLVGKIVEAVGANVVAQAGAKQIPLDSNKVLKVQQYFREARGLHYVEVHIQDQGEWGFLGYVPAESLQEKTTPEPPALSTRQRYTQDIIYPLIYKGLNALGDDTDSPVYGKLYTRLTTEIPAAWFELPEADFRGKCEEIYQEILESAETPEETTDPEPPRRSTPEGISESFLRSFKSNYSVPLDFGILLKGVNPVSLRDIAPGGIDNFFLLHEGVVREISWNGRDYVYAGTSQRASIHNGDMVYESQARYESDQTMINQKTLRNEEPKYQDYPLNGLIYLPTLEVNGVTVMRFQPSTRTKYINASIYHSLKALAIEFHAKTGQAMVVSSIYRTHSHQQQLYDQYGSGRAATPGNSKHNLGVAVDIAAESRGYFKDSSTFDAFAAQYGFDRPTWEEWHFEHIQSKAIRSDSGVSRPAISVMLDAIGRQEKREQFITQCINPTLQQAIVDGMDSSGSAYRSLYNNLYKLLEKPENLQLSVSDFDLLCTKERQRQHELDGRGLIPRITSRPQRTLAFDTSDIPRDKQERVIIGEHYVFIKYPVGENQYLRDFVGKDYEVLQLIDKNGQLVNLKWNPSGLGGTGTYEHNGKHYPISGGETILIYPLENSAVPEFTFRDGQMSRQEILSENARWLEFQINRLNEKWKEWYDDQPLLNKLSGFHPLTMHDVCGLISSESATRFRHSKGSHSNGEKGMLPLPANHGEWVRPVGGNPLNDQQRTARVEENILGMMEYMLALKHVSLAYSGGKTKYHQIINRFDDSPKKEAAYVLAVLHARGNNQTVIENIEETEGNIGYSFGRRQQHVTEGFKLADEILHTLGVEPEGGHAPHEEEIPDIDSPMTSSDYGERNKRGTNELPYRFVSATPQLYNGGALGFESSSGRFNESMAISQITHLAESGITYHINLLPDWSSDPPDGKNVKKAFDKAKKKWESSGRGPFPITYRNLFMSDYGNNEGRGSRLTNSRGEELRGQRQTAIILARVMLDGGKVYINCRNGMHRAPSATVLGLVVTGQADSWADAIEIAQLRESDFPNSGWGREMRVLTKLVIDETLQARRAFESRYGNLNQIWNNEALKSTYLAMLEDVYNGREIRLGRGNPKSSPELTQINLSEHFNARYITSAPDGSIALKGITEGKLVGNNWREGTLLKDICTLRDPSVVFYVDYELKSHLVRWDDAKKDFISLMDRNPVQGMISNRTHIYPSREAYERAQQLT